MKRIILLVLLLVVAGGGYLYYRHLSNGPEYSLMQAYKAVTDHDAAAFERYVDVSSVTGNLVDQVAEQSSALGVLNPGGFAMNGALRLLKPLLAQAAQKEIKRYVETGSPEATAEDAGKRPMNVSILGLADRVVGRGSAFKGVKYSREEGEQAFIGLEFTQPRYDTTVVVEVKMQDRGDHWQATEISNTGELLKHVARMEKQHLLGR